MNFKHAMIAALMVSSFSAVADDMKYGEKGVTLYNWGKDTGITYSAYTTNSKAFLRALISISEGGEQRLYFNYMEPGYKCREQEEFRDIGTEGRELLQADQIWTFGTQHIKMNVFCSDSFISATPKTVPGQNYIVDKFVNERSLVRVVAMGDSFQSTVDVSAVGFYKAWSSFGGDAL